MVARRVLGGRPREAPWTGRRDCVRRRFAEWQRRSVGPRRIVRLVRRVVRGRGARLGDRHRRPASASEGAAASAATDSGAGRAEGRQEEVRGPARRTSRPRRRSSASAVSTPRDLIPTPAHKLIQAARRSDSGGAQWSLGRRLDRENQWVRPTRQGRGRRRQRRGSGSLKSRAASGSGGSLRFRLAVRRGGGPRRQRRGWGSMEPWAAPGSGGCLRVRRAARRAGGRRRRRRRWGSVEPSALAGRARAGVRGLAEQEPRADSQLRVDEHELGAHWVVPLCRLRHVRRRLHDTIIGFPDRSLHLRSHWCQ